jgi:hypothetical protein
LSGGGYVGEMEVGEYFCKGLLVRAMVFNTQKQLNPNLQPWIGSYFCEGLLVIGPRCPALETLNPKRDPISAGFGGEARRGR